MANSALRFIHNPDLGLLIVRLMMGAVGIYHGGQKVFGAFGGEGMQGLIQGVTKMGLPMPMVFAWAAALSELLGGVLIALGLLTRVAAFFYFVTMMVAWVGVHHGGFNQKTGGNDYAFALAMVALGLIFTGAGRYALDAAILPHRREPVPRPA